MPNAPKKTMVCVTVQKTCERLIRAGASLAGGAGLSVGHVARSGEALLGGSSESEGWEFLFRISREYGAEMDMLRSDDVIDTIVDFAQRNAIETLVIGAAGSRSSYDVAGTLRARLPGVQVVVVA